MEFEVEGQVHQPQPGQELLIPVAAVHSARNIGSTTARWLYG
jgi:quercetin dioxygenase-like cupin family protein